MKKVYTLTTQFANNMGALLQCYALCKFLNQQDELNCKVINYFPKTANLSWEIFPKPRTFRDFLQNLYTASRLGFIMSKKRKNKLMRQFISTYIPLSEKSYNRDNIVSDPPIGDVFICGSDQIWNTTIFNDPTYYLDFVRKESDVKLISYAASIADHWSEAQRDLIKPLINRFDTISIREKGNMDDVQSIVTDKEIHWVLDPVFLLDAAQWDGIASKPLINEPYILCYFLNISPQAIETVKRLKAITGYKVVNLGISVRDKFNSDVLVRVFDPKDFISYIKNAAVICTNSFHCSAFSTIYHKDFCFIPKSWANERIISLQEIFGYDVIMTADKLKSLTLDSIKVDYSTAQENGQDFINASKLFLLNAINGNI